MPVWRRVAARGIDVLTVLFTMWALVVLQVFWFMDSLSDRLDPEPWGRAFVATALFAVLYALYEIVFLVHSKGQTPGRDVMKLRVIGRDGAEHVTWRQAVARWSLPGVAVLIPPVWLAALAIGVTGVTLARSSRRSVPDWLAGTVVVAYDRDKEDSTSRRARSWRRRHRWEPDHFDQDDDR